MRILIISLFLLMFAVTNIYAEKPVTNIDPANGNASISNIVNSPDADSPIKDLKIKTIEDFVNQLLPYTITFAGLILFAMLIMGGFEMMTAGTDSKKADAGKTRITQALIGFIIVFAAFWITQIVEIILGVNILK